ncbi:nicotinamidase-related amidase [Paenibacillus shirakamiensis]|uniref:Nicotinamidase-related amidase n=1 Tax=Paenibacillus shirakamiensis TaxID=1265935 RepID=A0ABS4JKR8_9BACL|nr:isochorismatase family protein [Paenibacillus shirakamiensis]MBP2001676.1 nicotinamidase-related amidase [Paenibacillus shirakamiensis]
MKALLVIDVQKGIVDTRDFNLELSVMKQIIQDFKASQLPIICLKHIDNSEGSLLHNDSEGSELHEAIKNCADLVIEKQTPSAFFNTDLSIHLQRLDIDHLFLIGFETEFCCMFTAISAYDRGYSVTFLQEAIGTTNTDDSYQMPGIDIDRFVSNILLWSNVIEVIDHRQYLEKYKAAL